MNRLLTFLFICLVSGMLKADPPGDGNPPKSNGKDTVLKLSLGGGIVFSTINMRIEPIGQIKSGWNARASLRVLKRMAIIGEYTHQNLHDAEPAWTGIQASNFDLSIHYLYLSVSNTPTSFYAITGACYQQWFGTYKGPAAVEGDNYNYKPGDQKTFYWTTINAGVGFQRIYNHLGLFGEFKFRFGKNNPSDPFGIVDVAATFGAKVELGLHRHKTTAEPTPKTPGRKKFSIAPKIYHWF